MDDNDPRDRDLTRHEKLLIAATLVGLVLVSMLITWVVLASGHRL